MRISQKYFFLLFITLILGSCRSKIISEQFLEQQHINTISLGEGNALRATILHGNVLSFNEISENLETEEVLELSFWASGPFPQLLIENGIDGDSTLLDITMHNAGNVAGNFLIEPINESATQQNGCQNQNILPYVIPAPLNRAPGPIDLQLRFELAPCTQLTFQPSLNEMQTKNFRLAFVGPMVVDKDAMTEIRTAIQNEQQDYVHFFGSLANSTDGATFDSFFNVFCPEYPICNEQTGLNAPFGVSFGKNDNQIREGFYHSFGQTDFLTSIGDISFLVLNSSSRMLSEEQFRFIQDIPTNGPPGIVVMDTPPFDMIPLRHHGFHNTNEAIRLQTLLESRNFKWIFSRNDDTFIRYNIGNINIFGIPSQQGFAQVNIKNALSSFAQCDDKNACFYDNEQCRHGRCYVSCSQSDDCENNTICNRNYCRTPCSTDSMCEEIRSSCALNGFCEEGISLNVQWIEI